MVQLGRTRIRDGSIGGHHQMCIILVKKDLKFNLPQGDVKAFLKEVSRLGSQYIIQDPHTRAVVAACLDKQMSDLMHQDWQDDEDHTINRYRKRHRREGYHLSTFLHIENVDSKLLSESIGDLWPYSGGNRWMHIIHQSAEREFLDVQLVWPDGQPT